MSKASIIQATPPFEFHGITPKGKAFHLFRTSAADAKYALFIDGQKIDLACDIKQAIRIINEN